MTDGRGDGGAGSGGGKSGGGSGGRDGSGNERRRGARRANRTGGDPRGRSRGPKVRVRTARGRKLSSTRWLERQLNDPYVAEAQRRGYRARSAFKLLELDEKLHLFRGVRRAVDLGCAPGSWLQVMVERLGHGAEVVGIDRLATDPVAGAAILEMDFLDPAADAALGEHLSGPVDLVVSDMAADTTGHKQTDHLRTMALCEAALDFAEAHLAPGGHFVAKVLQGGAEEALLRRMKAGFKTVKHVKPAASRPESVEWYVVAKGFRGRGD
ncbi:23S rRNA Um-2552 2'-O-methyltransferase [Rhodothalassium salexigens DSM 2132]|uniref:Ribosomal RNA large subunit methyltransferase E n=1 Tax=Rhodothalassium salexigens DSM 2132 TaxID=1188247 RepID=A0A4V2SQD2_RHOSA|nr:RlmE family RNA methyltransferase [Rhodothalassium salexigens]MBB4210362.1 23S rRNA (uridine2552-2'-O)-methyltransferase [Rhodothalassium salexigens DSM 2132]MBK1638903.1 23S rRNA methyltransferase [Rhodothalassium salexigens DSM 2132]TCP38526.1 23S rRNA Um-2552 2'-O-methyltransferase [Rhodothalassium salexigens DSM 2132]